MKQITLTLLAAVVAATAFVIPTEDAIQQISLSTTSTGEKNDKDSFKTLWDSVPDSDSAFSSVKKAIADGFERAIDDNYEPSSLPHELLGGGGHHGHHGDSSKTIYELIKESKYTQRFAKLVDEHDGIKALLSDTEKKNHTLFVPTDRAFEHIPPHREPPPKEFILALLKYHIVPGRYPVGRVLASHTIPTELASRALGDRPQRLRVGLTLFGVHLNFYSKVVATDIVAKNGIIHAVGAILVPPPPQSKLIRLLPGRFSTLSLALETTGLGEELDKVKEHATGGTVFAPTNHAFARLGRRANAFLFSEHGKKYLRALLRYHVVANETLYSDAYYKRKDDDGEDNDDDANTELSSSDTDYWHVDLPSLLGDKAIHIDVRRWKRFISIIINGHVRVSVQDGVARDGVIQVVDSVLIPPHKHHDHDHDGHDGGDDDDDSDKDSNGGISVDELRARLGPYVDDAPGNTVSQKYG